MRLPGFWDRRRRRVPHLRTGPVGDAGEIAHRLLHRLAARCGVHLQPGGDVEEQAARPAPSGAELCIGLGVVGSSNRVDLSHRGHEIIAGELLEQRVAPLVQRAAHPP